MDRQWRSGIVVGLVGTVIAAMPAACTRRAATPADLLLVNGNVYTLSWDDPRPDGTPAANAPHGPTGWKGDADAVAIGGSRVLFVGSTRDAQQYRGDRTRAIDLRGATVVPGLVDAHVHIVELGRSLERVNLVGVGSEAEAVEKVAARAASVPKGDWVVGYGWDDGAWANRYPDMRLLSERTPDHPVYLRGLHGYAVWGNRLAFEKAGITAKTPSPSGGEIRKDDRGRPTGILVNEAVRLLERAIPPPTDDQIKAQIVTGLEAMARAGYVAVHEAGVDTRTLGAFEELAAARQLPLRVYAMLSGRDHELLRTWLARGPDNASDAMLTTRSVKVFFDGALGSRGARLLADYSDRPSYRGNAQPETGFDPKLVAETMKAGFQVSIHAIGDAANREALDFIEQVEAASPETRRFRHRIEHAQVMHPDDFGRFSNDDVIASMQPPHAVEDKGWAEARVGPERVKYAYAWRSMRQAGARLVFSSDLPGSGYDIFYGLHSAVTRQDLQGQPPGGWHADERVGPEEALRGYTTWAAYTAFLERETGVLAPGRWADITVMNIDPLATGEKNPGRLLDGRIAWTIVGGRVAYERGR